MKASSLLLLLTFGLASLSHASMASDDAGNYATFTGNEGSGFLAWSFNSNNNGSTTFAGAFLGDSTAGAGNLNTSTQSFGLYANPGGAFIDADRGFASVLNVGDTFSFDMGVNFDNGNKGFNLFAGSQGEVFNFNIGGGAGVSSSNATINPATTVTYDYGGNDAVLSVSLTMTSSSGFTYDITRDSEQGEQGTLFAGTVSGLTEAPTGFRFYNAGTDSGAAQNNLYFNNLNVIPEPGAAILFLTGLGFIYFLRKRG